jgi:hypothetical protein
MKVITETYLMKVILETYLMKVFTETYLMKFIPEAYLMKVFTETQTHFESLQIRATEVLLYVIYLYLHDYYLDLIFLS